MFLTPGTPSRDGHCATWQGNPLRVDVLERRKSSKNVLGVLQMQENLLICLEWIVFRTLERGEGKVLSSHFSLTLCLHPCSKGAGSPTPHDPWFNCFHSSGLNIDCQCLGLFGRGHSPDASDHCAFTGLRLGLPGNSCLLGTALHHSVM